MNKCLHSGYAVPALLAFVFITPLNSVAEELDSEITVAQNGTVELKGMTIRAKPINRNLIKLQPFASTIVDRKELNQLKFVDPDEIMNRIPGQSLSRNLRIPKGGRGYTISVVDGVSVRDPYRGSTQQFQDNNTFDIERIEIIKGPTSVLYGSNAFGGVVNVITREPPIDPEYRAWFEGGSFDRIRGGLNTGGTVNDVGYFLDFNIWDIGGFQDFEKNARKAVSGKLIFHPDSLSNLTIRGEYLDRFTKSAGRLKQAQFDEDPRQNPRKDSFSEKETFSGFMKFDRTMWTDGHINANFGYRSEDNFAINTFGGGGPSDTKLDDLNAKLWYTHKFDFLNSSFMLGGDYFYGENDNKRFDQKKKSFVNKTAFTERKIYAGFAELKFSPIERLEITTAFRYETVETQSKSITFAKNERVRGRTQHTILDTPEPADFNSSFSKISPVAGFTFDLSKDHRFWFNYAQGFYVPNIRSLFHASNSNPNLIPEETELFQLGIRGAFLDNRLTYDLTFYYQDNINDLVDEVIGFDDVTGQNIVKFANAGSAHYRGVETEISYEPWDFLQLSVTHTYARNRYVDYINKNDDGTIKTDYSGNTLRISPEHHVNARIAVLPTEGLEIELEIDATTRYFTHDDNSLDPDGDYSRPIHLNLRSSYEKEGWELWLHALNLTNELEERVTYSPPRGGQGQGSRSINVADGISVYGGVAFNF
jgi:outer membrane receptor protein involved in Fe transport